MNRFVDTTLDFVELSDTVPKLRGRALRERVKALIRMAGGVRSGNFGHAGRPGEVGGSGGNQWTYGGGTVSTSDALSKLKEIAAGRKFIQLNEPNSLFAHLSLEDRAQYLKDFKHMPEARPASMTIKDIEVTKSLTASQQSVEVAEVADFVRHPGLAADSENPLPLVVTWHGREMIGDGHHRFTADRLLGTRSTRVEHVDLDAWLSK